MVIVSWDGPRSRWMVSFEAWAIRVADTSDGERATPPPLIRRKIYLASAGFGA